MKICLDSFGSCRVILIEGCEFKVVVVVSHSENDEKISI